MLLPYQSHSVAGIMRGQWDMQQVRAAERHGLSFSSDEAKVIRSTLMARTRLEALRPSLATFVTDDVSDHSRRTR